MTEEDQVGEAIRSGAVPRPLASSLMPLRGLPHQPDPEALVACLHFSRKQRRLPQTLSPGTFLPRRLG
jgi:hypothetical protein